MPVNFGPELLPYPQPSDAPDGPGAFLALLQKMVVGGIIPYTTYALMAATSGFLGEHRTVTSDPNPVLNGDYIWNSTGWQRVAISGLIPIIPTSVSGGTVAADGTITTSASSLLTVNGCFTTDFQWYLVRIRGLIKSSTSNHTFRLAAAGTPTTGTNYRKVLTYAVGSTLTTLTSLDSAPEIEAGVELGSIKLELDSPALARTTIMRSESSSDTYRSEMSITHSLSTAYDGFALGASGGIFTSDVRIWGYN